MIKTAADVAAELSAPPLAPADEAIDLAHLSRMTFGDASLEREVLRLFDRQADLLLARMRGHAQAAAAGFAHTLKGSARGIGAWRVAEAAARIEVCAAEASDVEFSRALQALTLAVGEVRAAIAQLLKAPASDAAA